MKKTIFILMFMWAGIVSAQIGSNPSNFSNGIKLPNATNEGDTITVDTKIPIMNNDQVVNYFANVSDILAMGMSGLTPNRALISDGSGDLAVSAVTTTELSYLDGLSSSAQDQIDSKLSRNINETTTGSLTFESGSDNLKVQFNGVIFNRGLSYLNASVNTQSLRIGGLTGTNWNEIQLNAENGVTTNGNLTATGTVTATNFILSSDKRLKENFVDLGNGYYSFNFKGSNEKRYGVIAQEVEKYAPELVSEGEDGYLKVAYIDLLIKKIAELEARVKELEKK